MKLRIVFAVVLVAVASSFAQTKVGLDFSTGSTTFIGPSIRISPMFEIKPKIGFFSAERDDIFSFFSDQNIYVVANKPLEHYINIGIGFTNIGDQYNRTMATLGYGVRYNWNETVSLFGQVGVGMVFDPFIMTSSTSGIGISINLL